MREEEARGLERLQQRLQEDAGEEKKREEEKQLQKEEEEDHELPQRANPERGRAYPVKSDY